MGINFHNIFADLKKNNGWRPRYNVAIEVRGFEGDPASAIRALALDGPEKGKEILVRLSKDAPENARPVSAFQKEGEMTSVEPGAILQADGLAKADDGVFEANWISVLSKDVKANPVFLDLYASVQPVTKYDRETRANVAVRDSNGVQFYSVRAFAPEQEIVVSDLDALKSTIADVVARPPLPAVEGNRGVVVTLLAPDGACFRLSATRNHDRSAPRQTEGGAWLPRKGLPVEELIGRILERIGGEEQARAYFANGVKAGVSPYAVMMVGGKNAEDLEKSIADGGRGYSLQTTNLERAFRDGRPVPGFARVAITVGYYPGEGDERNADAAFVRRLRASDSYRPVALEGVDTPLYPEASRIWREQEGKRQADGGASANAAPTTSAAATHASEAVNTSAHDEEAELDQILGMVENQVTA